MKMASKLRKKNDDRILNSSFRVLKTEVETIDFSSNDYLGFARNEEIYKKSHQYLLQNNLLKNGSTGSRLLTGNSALHEEVEQVIADFHQTPTSLLFNSGYDANLGFFSSVPQKGDVVLYDEFIHASVRDGINLSLAKGYKFKHNNSQSLQEKIELVKDGADNIYVVTESIFSMDGDSPDLIEFVAICKSQEAYLVVDEAHALGVLGEKGNGLVNELKVEKDVFARIVTFGKAIGCHGAAVLCNSDLRDYLINFSRSFIYTTALPAHSLANIKIAYETLIDSEQSQKSLKEKISFFQEMVKSNNVSHIFSQNNSPIQTAHFKNIEMLKEVTEQLNKLNFNLKAIYHPTVPIGKERLRICLHSFNTYKNIELLVKQIVKFAD